MRKQRLVPLLKCLEVPKEQVVEVVSDVGFIRQMKEILDHELKIIKLPPALDTLKIQTCLSSQSSQFTCKLLQSLRLRLTSPTDFYTQEAIARIYHNEFPMQLSMLKLGNLTKGFALSFVHTVLGFAENRSSLIGG